METSEWDIRDDIDIPANDDMAFAHPSWTADGKIRLDMDKRMGMRHRCARGYLVDISHATSENTQSPYEWKMLLRIVYL